MKVAEDLVLLAILAVSGLHGEAALRLDTGYRIDQANRMIVVDTATEIGRAVARVALTLATSEFGADAISVRRSHQAGEVHYASCRPAFGLRARSKRC